MLVILLVLSTIYCLEMISSLFYGNVPCISVLPYNLSCVALSFLFLKLSFVIVKMQLVFHICLGTRPAGIFS